MNKLIEKLVEQTFESDSYQRQSQWRLIDIPHLDCYWLESKNWYFPKGLLKEYIVSGRALDPGLDLASLFESHHTSEFYIKKNEEDNSLVLYIQTNDSKLAA